MMNNTEQMYKNAVDSEREAHGDLSSALKAAFARRATEIRFLSDAEHVFSTLALTPEQMSESDRAMHRLGVNPQYSNDFGC